MQFKNWLEMSSYRDALKGLGDDHDWTFIPQNPKHHPEGDVKTHTRMVREALYPAIKLMKQAQQDPDSPFSNFDMNLTSDEINMLRLAGDLHDIGKGETTEYNPSIGKDKKPRIPYKELPPGYEGKEGEKGYQAIGHENPEHFEKAMKKLGPIWQKMYKNASKRDIDDLWYLIAQHMSLKNVAEDKETGEMKGGFGKIIKNQWIDGNGKYKNERRIKLLLILIIMDRMGRGTGVSYRTSGPQALAHMGFSAQKQKEKLDKDQELRDIHKANANLSPKEFVIKWIDAEKPLSPLERALRGKFPDLSDEEIKNILP